MVPLRGLTSRRILQRLGRGQVVRLEASGSATEVKTEDGLTLGRLDPRIGRRLAEFIRSGNRYAAAIADVDGDQVKIFVRETYQHPQLAGRLSFPPLASGQAEIVRPYIRDLGLHLQEILEAGLEEEEEEEEEEEAVEEEEELEGEEEAGMIEEEFIEEPLEEEEEEDFTELDEEL